MSGTTAPTGNLIYCDTCRSILARSSSRGVQHGIYPLVGVQCWYERRAVLLRCPNTECQRVNRLTVGFSVR